MRCLALHFLINSFLRGGTSLSKGWGLIERFSEDIDIALDRSFLGFGFKEPSSGQIQTLRSKSSKFVKGAMCEEICQILNNMGIYGFRLDVSSDMADDPQTINVEYDSILNRNEEYVKCVVKIEVGVRFNYEPSKEKEIGHILSLSDVGKHFCNERFSVRIVLPQATFFEKILLLHEHFRYMKGGGDRISRHLYDLERIMSCEELSNNLQDRDLYMRLLKHRYNFIRRKGFDYNDFHPSKITIIPNDDDNMKSLSRDYKKMRELFIYGKALSFKDLIKRIEILQSRIRKLDIDDVFFENSKVD